MDNRKGRTGIMQLQNRIKRNMEAMAKTKIKLSKDIETKTPEESPALSSLISTTTTSLFNISPTAYTTWATGVSGSAWSSIWYSDPVYKLIPQKSAFMAEHGFLTRGINFSDGELQSIWLSFMKRHPNKVVQFKKIYGEEI